ncbi:MAG: TasA family protein, partial [Candidatus Borkfalkiaceae bacterium]|nr:TasA family protein [Christensenellaceae bacterium]
MTSSKFTKRALISSTLAIFICVSMLIGTTFAWFTDTASTAVNKIQSGTLDVALEMSNDGTTWESAEGKTLTFKTQDNRAADQILWEPGCTYELPKLRVVNKGNLALKYKIQITGINGDAKLNEVIDWTINDAPINLTEKHLSA